MSISNVRYEIAGANGSSCFFRQRIPEFRNILTRHFPFWRGILLTCLLILLYFSLSVGLTSYQQWMLNIWGFPFGIVVCHLFIKFLLSAIARHELKCHNDQRRVKLSCQNMIMTVAPPGIASGFEIGFSNWALQLLTASLYTMTKSTTIVFILGFALLFQLERKSWSLMGIVMLISGGLAMFVYQSTEVHVFGMILTLLGSISGAFRWTVAQHVMQKSKLGLEHPIDMMYYIQPWMLLGTIPVALWFEGTQIYNGMLESDWTDARSLAATVVAIFSGAVIAFCLELTEYMIISRTSSLSLSVAGICKTLCIFLLANGWGEYLISDVNYLGLQICFAGIILYVILKLWATSEEENETLEASLKSDVEKVLMISNKNGIITISDIFNKEKRKYQIIE